MRLAHHESNPLPNGSGFFRWEFIENSGDTGSEHLTLKCIEQTV